jgi:hypothetical protein
MPDRLLMAQPGGADEGLPVDAGDAGAWALSEWATRAYLLFSCNQLHPRNS